MRIIPILMLIALSQLTACTVIPGMHMNPFAKQSSVEIPVTDNNKTTLKKLNIKLITAQLILDLEKDFNNRSLGVNNAANLYFAHRIGSKAVKGVPDTEPYYQYAVGPRDVLNITVWEHPELTIPAGEFRSAEASGTVVGEDGNIFYPYAGIIKAAGRFVEDIREELVRKLSAFIEMVQLDVRVTAYRSQRVYVVGEVMKPGIQTVKDIPLTVLEAINSAEGVKPEADLRNLTLTREGKSYTINLLSLYEGGDLSQNVLLKHGDVLNVPDSAFNKIFVLGETTVGGAGAGRGRSVVMNKGRMTLAEALSESGGVNQETSDPSRIFVFRSGINKPEIFHLDAKSPDALLLADRFPMQPRDVVYVDRAEGIRWNQIIAQIQPTVSLLSTFGTIKMEPFLETPSSTGVDLSNIIPK
ncbi:polysaccharide biosynthesis/export family protein [Crenothrix polyspora]|uniref:Polysaccharide export protein n=1 Tax=Crenothrix polyspora TaxID=360316 RepID=A0A1R4HC30_9GAMM|nr:polysaccharide biosynthesis/export family protein [Crenothrix polyspora]SJM93769.1 Polysaccharide export protein [Crenothrix polyspora]